MLALGRLNILRYNPARMTLLTQLPLNCRKFFYSSTSNEMTEQTTEKLSELVLDAEGKPLTKNALKKLQKEREKEERKRQVAERLEQERLAREAASPVLYANN